MKVVINKCFGGFGLSEAAYEKLIEYGIPVRKYIEQERDPVTRLYIEQPLNEGEVIFDRNLDDNKNSLNQAMYTLTGRYWDTWLRSDNRTHPLLVRVVEELGKASNGRCADLKIVDIPDGTEYEIKEYDGNESIHEVHQAWY